MALVPPPARAGVPERAEVNVAGAADGELVAGNRRRAGRAEHVLMSESAGRAGDTWTLLTAVSVPVAKTSALTPRRVEKQRTAVFVAALVASAYTRP